MKEVSGDRMVFSMVIDRENSHQLGHQQRKVPRCAEYVMVLELSLSGLFFCEQTARSFIPAHPYFDHRWSAVSSVEV